MQAVTEITSLISRARAECRVYRNPDSARVYSLALTRQISWPVLTMPNEGWDIHQASRSRNLMHLNSGDEPVICGHGAARPCALLLDSPSFQPLFAQWCV